MLGSRIAAIRKENNMSQTQLAGRLRVSPSAVGMYEQGRRVPDLDTLVRLAQVFDVSLDYLITGKERQHIPLPVTGRYELTRDETSGQFLLRLV